MGRKKKPVRVIEELTPQSFICIGELEYVHRKSLIIKVTSDYVAKFGGILRLEDRTEVARVYETFGTLRDYRIAGKMLGSLIADNYIVGTKFYMTGDHIVPLINFFPLAMRPNFKYTPQESDSRKYKRPKKKKYKPIPQRDVSGAGYGYIPAGSDGRCYVAEGPFCRSGVVQIRGTPVVYGKAPPHNGVKKRVTQGNSGRGTFVATTPPPVGLPPGLPTRQYNEVHMENAPAELGDITQQISGMNILTYSPEAASNPQYQLSIQASQWRECSPGYMQTQQWGQASAEPPSNWRNQPGLRNISPPQPDSRGHAPVPWQQKDNAGNEQCNWRQGRDQHVAEGGHFAARGGPANYGQYNRDVPAQEASAALGNYPAHGRGYGQPQAGYHAQNQGQYGGWNVQQPAGYDHGNRGNYSNRGQRGRRYDQGAGYWQQQSNYEDPANRAGQRGQSYEQPPGGNREDNRRGGNYQQRYQNYPAEQGAFADRGRGYGQSNFRGRGRGGNQGYAQNYGGGAGGYRGQQHGRRGAY